MTQAEQILQHLQEGHILTPLDALQSFGCMRLAARIHDLRREGHVIESQMVTVPNRHGEEVSVCAYYIPPIPVAA